MFEQQVRELSDRRRTRAESLTLFDAGLWLGSAEGFPLAEEMDLAQLADAMAKHSITGGLLSHWRGKTVSPQDGNLALLAALGDAGDGVMMVQTGLPLTPAEAGPLPGAGQPHQALRGVRLFPASNGYPLTSWCVGGLFRWLIDRRLPLLLWHTELDWRDLHALAGELPELTILVETQPRKILYHVRALAAVMRDRANVLVETSNVTGDFFEYAVSRFGPERLVFGSFLPMNDPWAPIGMILDADIPDADRRLIAGGNLQRLCDGVRL